MKSERLIVLRFLAALTLSLPWFDLGLGRQATDCHIATNCARRAPVRLDLPYNIVMKFFETGSVGACRNSVSANRLMSRIGQ